MTNGNGTRRKRSTDLAHRFEGNPIITVEDMPFRCADICNAAAVKLEGETLLLLTVESLRGRKKLYRAVSGDGIRFEIDDEPFLDISEEPPYAEHEAFGLLDPKITKFGDEYFITYTAFGTHGFRLALAKTKDFQSVERLGFISEPDSKGGVLFPEKINGRYAKLEMPENGQRLWISYSDDLTYWGGFDEVMSPRPGFWDFHKIGPAVPPIRVDNGEWLLIYYGVKNTSAGSIARLGAVFLDADDPSKTTARTNVPILSPREMYERVGDIGNVVFACGAAMDGDNLAIYYGASMSCICLATVSVDEIRENCAASEREF